MDNARQMVTPKKMGPTIQGEVLPPEIKSVEVNSGRLLESKGNEYDLVIDPNLLCGSIYERGATLKAIQKRLSDITSKLHRTLFDFDELYKESLYMEDPIIVFLRAKLASIERGEMKDHLTVFMHKYENMHKQDEHVNEDRDELLLQLADWFTASHADLTNVKAALGDEEQSELKRGYLDAMKQFEQLKKLQNKIIEAATKGQNTKAIEKKKRQLDTAVVNNFKVMNEVSFQTAKLKATDSAPWKYAADEIVQMLRRVRTENADEFQCITKQLQELVGQLEKQELTIKTLESELTEKKELAEKFASENVDLLKEIKIYEVRKKRHKKDPAKAKHMMRKLQKRQNSDAPPIENFIAKTISTVLGIVKSASLEPMRRSSEPTLLRTQLRELTESLEVIRSECMQTSKELDGVKTELKEKKEYIVNIERENEKHTNELKRLRQDLKQDRVPGKISEPIEEKVEEVLCSRMKQIPSDLDAHTEEIADKDKSLEKNERELSPSEIKRSIKQETVSLIALVEDRKEKPNPAPGENTEIRSRYMDKLKADRSLPRLEKKSTENLLRLEKKSTEFQVPAEIPPEQHRVWSISRFGELQGRLTFLISEIMEFVTDICRMMCQEKEEDKMVCMITSIDLGQQTRKKPREAAKEEENLLRKRQIMFSGQQAAAKLNEALDLVSNALNIKPGDNELINQSFRMNQKRNRIKQEVMFGRIPLSVLKEFDASHMKEIQDLFGLDVVQLMGDQDRYFLDRDLSQPRKKLQRSTSSLDKSEEDEGNVEDVLNIFGIQRSKSDLDIKVKSKESISGKGLIREKSQVYFTHVPDHVRKENTTLSNREEIKATLTTVPKKGMIHLMSDVHEVEGRKEEANIEIQGGRRMHQFGNNQLIRDRKMIEHIKAGSKLLKETETKRTTDEEISKRLGEYTIKDLQLKIMELTDIKELTPKRRTLGDTSCGFRTRALNPTQSGPGAAKLSKKIVLPAINIVKPY